jgi:hypothetical protein
MIILGKFSRKCIKIFAKTLPVISQKSTKFSEIKIFSEMEKGIFVAAIGFKQHTGTNNELVSE